MSGGAGADSLYGGVGNDTLTGGNGSDSFYFDTALNAVTNVDQIVDFSAAADTIVLDLEIFAGLAGTGALSAGAFRAGTAAADGDDRIIYDQASGKLYYDADGDASGAQVLFAQLAAGSTLTSNDFLIVA